MHCKACDCSIQVTWRAVEGLDKPILEDLCSNCQHWARAAAYDGGPPNEMDVLLETLGVRYEKEDSEEGY